MFATLHRVLSVVVAIAFVVIMQVFATPIPVFRFLVPSFIVFVLGAAAYNLWYLQRLQVYNLWVWLRIPLFLVAWFGVYFVLPGSWWRGIFLAVSVPIIFFFQALLGRTGQQLLLNEVLLTVIAFLGMLFGLSFYYLIPGVLYLLVGFGYMLMITRASFELIPHANAVKWIVSLSISLFIIELFWVTHFLPFHFSALAGIVFIMFYVVWIICYQYLYNNVTLRQIQFHIILAGALVALIFLITPWSIQS